MDKEQYWKEVVREKSRLQKEQKLSSLHITIMLTDECNFRCSYCFETNKQSIFLTKDNIVPFIDAMFDFSEHPDYWKNFYLDGDYEKIHFLFFGGEPLLNVKMMTFILDYFENKCKEDLSKYQKRLDSYSVAIVTNGSLLDTKDSIEYFDKYAKKTSVNVTYEGCKEFHDRGRKYKNGEGTYDKVRKNIIWYKEKYGGINIQGPAISKDTIDYTYKCYEGLKEFSNFIDMKIETYKKDLIWSEDEINRLDKQYELITEDLLKNPEIDFKQFRKYDGRDKVGFLHPGCSLGRGMISVDADGLLYPCYNFGPIMQPLEKCYKYSLGDSKNGISENGERVIESLYGWGHKRKYVDTKCQSCTYSFNCNICPAENYLINDDINICPTTNCDINNVVHKWALIYHYKKGV